MLGRLHPISAHRQLPRLLASLQCGVLSQLSPSAACEAPFDVRNITYSTTLSTEAAVSSTADEAKQAAQELGLDAVPLAKLRELMANALPNEEYGELVTPLDPPHLKKLKYTDIDGYQEAMSQLAMTPQEYDIPKTPALDAGQWVDTHFKEAGISFEPRSGFYNWRGWAKANLSEAEYELLQKTESVMADDSTRSALLKQVQHELARLWDWQHRRAALGLSPDVDPAAAAAAAAAAAQRAAEEASAAAAAELEAQKTAAAAELEAQQTAAAAEQEQQQQLNSAASSSSSSRSDGGAAAAAAAAEQQEADFSNKGMLDLLNATGVLSSPDKSEADKLDEAMQTVDTTPAVTAPVWITAVEDVADRTAMPGTRTKLSYERAAAARAAVERLLAAGERSVKHNTFRGLAGVKVRQYRPKSHDDDLFLPSKPRGSWKLDKLLSDSTKILPVDPDKVTRQAVAIVEAARRAAEFTAIGGIHGDAGRGEVDGADWLSMPLLDRAVLHKEKLREEQARLEAKPKMQTPWDILAQDDYTFDLRIRPPTLSLDLLSSYLEVKYADVLLRKDAVQTLNRQLAVQQLTQGDGSTTSEVTESPPAALTAAKTLSLAEREGIVQALDDLLDKQQYEQYRDVVMQLYCDGLVTWGELQQCWAAAEAGAELAAATGAEGHVALADDRDQLFKFISGQQQLGSLTDLSSSSSSTADTAAAKQLWKESGKKLAATLAAAAAKTALGSSSSSDPKTLDAWSEPVEYEEAQRTWQQLLLIAGLPNGPRFEQVLLAQSSSSSRVKSDLHQQLQQLQEALQKATGLNAAAIMRQGGSSSSDESDEVFVADLDAWRRLCVSPPSLEHMLKQHWDQVALEELGQEQQWQGPIWQQLWQLLGDLTHKHQQQQQQQQEEVAAAAGDSGHASDATAMFQRYLRSAECTPLSPPPYPGASRLLRWEQTMVLGPTSGQITTAPELKVKLQVDADELRKETGISKQALRHILRIAGNRFNPSTGLLTIKCERFPTREENRRWCLEVLHRLLQEGQRKHPSSKFLLGSDSNISPAAVLA